MKDMVCIITGSNSGIGKETALALSSLGAKVVMAVRDKERGEKAQQEIIDTSGNRNTYLILCDLASIKSIKRFSEEFKSRYSRLDVLINNAGAVFNNRQITEDGFERTF